MGSDGLPQSTSVAGLMLALRKPRWRPGDLVVGNASVEPVGVTARGPRRPDAAVRGPGASTRPCRHHPGRPVPAAGCRWTPYQQTGRSDAFARTRRLRAIAGDRAAGERLHRSWHPLGPSRLAGQPQALPGTGPAAQSSGAAAADVMLAGNWKMCRMLAHYWGRGDRRGWGWWHIPLKTMKSGLSPANPQVQ